jgi:hypothetical protein
MRPKCERCDAVIAHQTELMKENQRLREALTKISSTVRRPISITNAEAMLYTIEWLAKALESE